MARDDIPFAAHAGLEEHGHPPELAPHEEPAVSAAGRESERAADPGPDGRDMRPALGTRGGPASWMREVAGAGVALAHRGFGDSRWSYLFKAAETDYATEVPGPGEIAAANRRGRAAPVPAVQGPFIKGPVWTWEVPLYFWVGGVASGASFAAAACDAAGDRRSARLARRVTLATVAPAPVLLIADLGRPRRFLNMMRIVKPRSPMNMGAWCLVGFSATAAAAVGADLVRKPRAGGALGAVTALLGGYLGSYTGVLLASTAVPVWARSRIFLGPIFVSTATATGAAATRLTLVNLGLPERHPTRHALRSLETAAILAELLLSTANERRLGPIARPLRHGTSGRLFRIAQTSVVAGLAAQIAARRGGRRFEDAASVLFLAGGLAFRYAWVFAGRTSAADHSAAAATGRGRLSLEDGLEVGGDARAVSLDRRPLPAVPGRHVWTEVVRRVSLAIDHRPAARG